MAKEIDGTMLSWTKDGKGPIGVGEVSTFFGSAPVTDTLIVNGRKERKIFLGFKVGRPHGQHGEIDYFLYKAKEGNFRIKLYND